MAYNSKSKRHVNWPAIFCRQAFHQDSSDVGVLLCVKAKCVLPPSYNPAPPPEASGLGGVE